MMRFSPFIRPLLLTATVLCAAIAASSAPRKITAGVTLNETRSKNTTASLLQKETSRFQIRLWCRDSSRLLQNKRVAYTKPTSRSFRSTSSARRTDDLRWCFAVWGWWGRPYVFDFADFRRPKLLELPFIAQNGGFGATPRPGLIIWKRDAGVFEAVTISDVCPDSELRHAYRLDSTGAVFSSPSIAIAMRVEVREKPCGRNSTEWTTVWEASPWPAAATVR